MPETAELKRTPLFDVHVASKAKMVDFGGWNMPVQYSGIIEEHNAVRRAVGLFDVSHMGEIEIRGPEAAQLTDFVTTNNVGKMKLGQAHYSGLLNESGGFVDDILVHRIAEDHFFLCVNASNQEKDFEHIRDHNRFNTQVDFASERYAQFAIQGPRALATLQKLTSTNLNEIKYYWFVDGQVAGIPARIAHTGYTGEDGFEIYIPPTEAVRIWHELLQAGKEFAIKPCGLGARNTLRLEAKMALYGHELTDSINPFEADLAWIVKMNKGEFVGRAALEKAAAGVSRKLAGFEMVERGIGRDGYEITINGAPAGWVTSGGPSPTLNKNIGLCYLPADKVSQPGVPIEILIRNTPMKAVTVPTPFYKRSKA